MKNYKLPFLGFTLVLLIASCKKEDVRQTKATDNGASATTSKAQWNSLNNWLKSTTEDNTTYFSKVTDSSVTSDVVNTGLVLVYKKSGNEIQSLPFQEKDSKTYWYYQVSKGSIRINSDNNDGQNLNAQSFTYFVVTPQQLSTLESGGKSKFDLLQLSYDQAVALLK